MSRLPVIKREVMKMKSKIVRVAVVAIALLAVFAMPYPSPKAASNWKVFSIPMIGLEGASNNVALAFDRFAIVAPYAPKKPADQIKEVSDLDNYFLYVADTKKPNDQIWVKGLESYDPSGNNNKRVYYPTRVLFDPASRIVYVRGTRYEKVGDEYEEIEVVAYTRLNLDNNGKPVFDTNVVVIDIKGVGDAAHCVDAPLSFAFGQRGSYLVFTNGASFFTYNVEKGYIYQVDIVPAKEFGEDSHIAYLDIDDATNTVIVGWNRKQTGTDGGVKNFSELSFYNLKDDGIVELRKRVYADQFPDASWLITGSNIIVTAHSGSNPDAAYFATSDGSICQVDFDTDGLAATAKRLYKFDDLAAAEGEDASPRLVQYDPLNRVIGVARQGYMVQIHRPATGKRGRGLVRSLSAVTLVDGPALGLVKLGKKNKMSATLFTDGFADGITSFITGRDSEWLLATRSGDLLAVENADNPAKAQLQWQTQLGARTDRVAYYSARDSLVAVESCAADGDGGGITTPGSLVVAKRVDLTAQAGGTPVALGATRATRRSPEKSGQAPAIRRPCNFTIKN